MTYASGLPICKSDALDRPDYLPRVSNQGMSEAYRLKLKIDAVTTNLVRADGFHKAALAARTPEDRARMEQRRNEAHESANFDAMAIQVDAMSDEQIGATETGQMEAAE